MTKTNETFAEWLLAERKQRGWTQRELAERVTAAGSPCHPTKVSKAEAAGMEISLSFAVAAATAFEASLDVVFGLVMHEDDLRRAVARNDTFLRALRTLISCELKAAS